MQISPEEFKEAFKAAFIVNRRYLLWNTKARRIAHMTAYIYRTIADSFWGVDIEHEHREIEAVLYRQGGSPDEILIAMENENNVRSLGRELKNLCALNCPLSVIVTYTGLRNEYLKRHMLAMEEFRQCSLLLIVNPEDWNTDRHQWGESIPWHFLLYANSELVLI